MEPGAELDISNLGIQAFPDGDDYILDGQEHFVGQALWPDHLWTLALTNPEALPDEATATFLVPAGLEGIRIQTPRLLLPGEAHRVTFDQVRVPRTCLLGNDREGWPLMNATLLAEPVTERASSEEQEVADLLQYAKETTREGVSLSEEPTLQQLLLEAYINSRISRLFHMRNTWLGATGQPLTYHAAQTALWEKRTALRLSEIVREVVGIYALLDHQDPRAPTQGEFELQQRRSLAQQNPSGTVEVYAGVMAKRLGLGKIKRGRRVAPPKEASTGIP
jgi:alkylation response protein AidB-like acyl-CoA dehydrogenase